MFTVRKTFKFEMAHRLSKAYTRACIDCIHGHSYVVEFFFSKKNLNAAGMVVDFGEVKRVVKPFIDALDHALMLHEGVDLEKDREIRVLMDSNKKIVLVKYNPTAEEMARDLFQTIKLRIHCLTEVRIHETDTGWASYKEG